MGQNGPVFDTELTITSLLEGEHMDVATELALRDTGLVILASLVVSLLFARFTREG